MKLMYASSADDMRVAMTPPQHQQSRVVRRTPTSALTQTEAQQRGFERSPQNRRTLEAASMENDGTLVLWNGRGEGVDVPAKEQAGVVSLLLTGRIRRQHTDAIADSIEFGITPRTQAVLLDLYAELIVYQPPTDLDSSTARWEQLVKAQAKSVTNDPSNLERLHPHANASLLWTINRDYAITAACGDAADEMFEQAEATRRDRIGQLTIFDLLGTDDPQHLAVASHIRALAGHPSRYQYRDNAGRHWSCFVEPVKNRSGDVIGAVGYGVDNTAAIRVQIPEIDEAYCVTSPQGALIQYSRPFKRMFGIEPTITLAGRPLLREAFLRAVADPSTFISTTRELFANEKPASDLIEMVDGRTLHRFAHPVRSWEGSIRTWAMFWNLEPTRSASQR